MATAHATILVVEDDASVRKSLLDLLGDNACVIASSRVKDALTLLDCGVCPDVVITDWRMPGSGGAELIAGLRANLATAQTPVIVVTGLNDVKINDPRTRILAKPFSLDDLLSWVQSSASALAPAIH